MPATWYLVQYTADLRRHEPRNIGLALTDGAHWYLHFRGVDDLGRVDARQIRGWGISRETYQSWVDYFHRKALQGAWEEALTLQQRKPSNFSVVSGGMLLAEESDWELEAKQLFSELVTTRPHRVTAPSPLSQLENCSDAPKFTLRKTSSFPVDGGRAASRLASHSSFS